MIFSKTELSDLMEQCIDLAKNAPRGLRKPYVGALVVTPDKKIVGAGYKSFIDDTSFLIHAERMALDSASDYAQGSYLFTTLEPCIEARSDQILKSCSELLVERGIIHVVIGLLDNGFYVGNGRGIQYLKLHGVDVTQYLNLSEKIRKELVPIKRTQRELQR